MHTTKSGWRWGVGAAAAMIFLALLPQLHFRISRGSTWHGANAIMHPDEVVYSAYTAELIRGRSRRNDPYTGRQDWPDESSYTIQMIPAYAVAAPARWLGLSAATAFILFPALFAFLAGLSIYWFIASLSRDKLLGAAAVWIVLGLGTLAAGQGLARHFVNLPYLIPQWFSKLFLPTSVYHLPFLRFYQPAVAFPCFFLFCTLVWRALNDRGDGRGVGLGEERGRPIMFSLAAGVAFAVLIFSYFFLWTAAAAWFALLGVLWLSACAGDKRRQSLIVFGVVAGSALVALIPYSLLMSHRPAALDSIEALVWSRRPDLFRIPELIGFGTMTALAVAVRRARVAWRDPVFLFATSLAALPLVVFNQQVITGRSLQPLHYEWFIANYAVLASVVLTASLWRRAERAGGRRRTDRRLLVVALCALLFGAGEVWLTIGLHLPHNNKIDDARPVMMRLASMAAASVESGGAAPSRSSGPQPVVLMADLVLADRLPTDAPQAVLWAPRMMVFSGVTPDEDRARFFQQLYYTGFDERKFRAEYDRGDWNFYVGLFSYARLSPVMGGQNEPITPSELETRLQSYLAFARSFNRDRAIAPTLSYLVVSADGEPDYANLDRWYQRDAGERVEGFVLYRLTLKY